MLNDSNSCFREAKIQFTKYCAPLFHLAGIDITVVEVHYFLTISLSGKCISTTSL